MSNAVIHSPFSVFRFKLLAFVVVLGLGCAVAQHAPAARPEQPAAPQHAPQQPAQGHQQPGINEQFGQPLATQSEAAAGEHAAAKEENSQEKMEEELRSSPSVKWLADLLHISVGQAYWVGIGIDFLLLALILVWALKKNLPAMFRSRTGSIQKAMVEAQKASEEANQRLADIETRLSRLDQEVAGMRRLAEQETAAEEQRIQAAAEEDKRRIVEAAEAEIAATAKLAERELKAFAADLAVSLAEKRIHVDANTDRALVRSFAEELGADSHGGGPGKDGH